MQLWWAVLIVCLAGAVGGVVNSFLSDNGITMPRLLKVDNITIVQPGFVGNIFIGAIAAAVSWGLYGPFAASLLFGTKSGGAPETVFLTLSGFVGGILVGIGGARWLTNEVDKSILKVAASKAASAPGSPGAGMRMMMSTPAQALRFAQSMSTKATLVKVNNVAQTRVKLPAWTDDDPDKMIKDVQNGHPRVITSIDCDNCKRDLEESNGAEVIVT